MREKTYYCNNCQTEVPESQLVFLGGGFSVPYGEGYICKDESVTLCPYCESKII